MFTIRTVVVKAAGRQYFRRLVYFAASARRLDVRGLTGAPDLGG